MRIGTLVLTVAGLSSAAAAGIVDLRVTELYAGVSGPNGTSDWIELTNTGPASVTTDGLFYDDDSFDPEKDDAFDSLSVASGESVVFLVSWEDDYATASEAVDAFRAFWGIGASVQVATVDGGSGLEGGGDAAAVFDGNTAGASLLTSAAYNSTQGGTRSTIHYGSVNPAFRTAADGDLSDLSQAWTFESAGTAGDANETLFGSPGVVPTPGAVSMLGLAGLVAATRRRH